jgi:hypothetical protein
LFEVRAAPVLVPQLVHRRPHTFHVAGAEAQGRLLQRAVRHQLHTLGFGGGPAGEFAPGQPQQKAAPARTTGGARQAKKKEKKERGGEPRRIYEKERSNTRGEVTRMYTPNKPLSHGCGRQSNVRV